VRTFAAFAAGLLVLNLVAALALTRCAARGPSATIVVDAGLAPTWEAVAAWSRERGGAVQPAREGGETRVELEGQTLWIAVQAEHDGRTLVLLRARAPAPLEAGLSLVNARLAALDPELRVLRPPGRGPRQ
jgi:hypothetical protein